MLTRADLRLLPGAGVLWILAVVGAATGVRGTLAVLALVLVLAFGTAILLGRPALLRALLSHAALVLIGMLVLLPAVARLEATRVQLEDAASTGADMTLSVIALGDAEHPAGGPAWAAGDWQLMARTLPERAGPRPLPASVRVLVRAGADGPTGEAIRGVRIGDRVRMRARVRTDGSLVILTVRHVETVEAGSAWRGALRERARQTTARLPRDEAALLRGMTTGDTSGLSAPAEDAMRRAGISHLVAVSGANIALVLGSVLAPLLLLGVPRRPRLLLAGAVGAGYVLLVGEEPSVLRAATMAAPILAARFVGVRARPVTALAATLGLWACLSPQTAASIGFCLSALATGAILVLARPVASALRDLSDERLPQTAALVLAVPLVAQLVCTPVLLLLTPEISVWAVPVNMLVASLVGPATVLGLAGLLLGPVLPGAASALETLGAGSAHLVLLIARTADALPGARIAVPGGPTGALLALGVLTLAGLALATRRSRPTRWAVAVLLVVALAPPLAQHLPGIPGGADGTWTIAPCAVGQGDAVVLRASPATGTRPATVLVDTGPEPEDLTACLDALGIHRIDLLVITHPHADHVGGRSALTGDRRPAAQWICPLPEARTATAPGVPAAVATRGTTARLPGLAIDVLWPVDADGVERAAARETSSSEQGGANDCSIVLSVTWPDGTRYVGLGDLEPAAQQELSSLDPGPADVVKVAHHGSRRQDAGLYRDLSPRLAVITVGEDNTFGHPATPTLTLLASLGAPAVRTDRDGTVEIAPTGPSTRGTGPGTVAETRSVGPAR